MGDNQLVIFIETPPFERLRADYFGDEHYRLLQVWLMANPEAGDMIRGSGGIRKLRWGTEGRGKRGGLRIIYYYMSAQSYIYFLTLYSKSEVSDLSRDEIKILRKLVEQIKEN